MQSAFVRQIARLAPLALTLAAAPLAAQRAIVRPVSSRPTVFDVTPYVGYAHFGELIDGPLGTSLRSAGAPLFGAQAGLAVSQNVSIIGNVAYGSSDLQVGVPILGGVDVGTTKNLIYDAGVEVRFPLAGAYRTVTPFVQGGAGAIRTRLENSLVHTTANNFALNGGAGLDLSLGGGFGVRAMVKDYARRFDASNDIGLDVAHGDWAHNVAGSLGVRVSF